MGTPGHRTRRRVLRGLAVVAVVMGLSAPAAAQVVAGTASTPVTVVVDPAQCGAPAGVASTRVVCTVSEVSKELRSGGRVLVRAGAHRGSLDLRGLSHVTVRGDVGAVIDAAGGRYALSLRDAQDVAVTGLALRGGSAQTIWVDDSARITLDRLVVDGSRGAGVQIRDSRDLRLTRSRVTGAASAGVMELAGVLGSHYEQLTVSGNGLGAAAYNGDGIQLSGTRVAVRDVVVTSNGSSARFEHGIYVSSRARDVVLTGITARDNSGVAVKLGGSGRLERSTLHDDGTALYCGPTAGAGWTVGSTTAQGPAPTHRESGCSWTLGA